MDSMIPTGQKNTLAKEYRRMILESIEHGPLIWPTIEENGVTRTKKYVELSPAEKIQADYDMKVINVILQGLPTDIYSLVNHHRVAKDLWEKSSTINASKFVTDVKLVKDLHTTNFDQLYAYLEQHELYANEVHLMRERNQDPLALLRNSSNPRQKATIHNGRVTVRPLQGRQNSYAAGTLGTRANTSGIGGNYSGMYKPDPVILAPKVKNYREAHEYKLKHTMEQAAILREVVKQAKSQNPLDSASYSACMYVKLIQELLGYIRDTSSDIHKPSEKLVAVVQIVLWYLDFGCSKHMIGDRSQLSNFVHKFLGTVKFGNDQVAKIIRYGDYQIGNVIISRVYYVEGLRHNLFSVGQFCDSDIEVAFRKHTCFVRNLEGIDLLSGSRGTNLYSLSIGDMMASSPICLLSKATKTKSWLWHRRLYHLNFGALNHLARNGLVCGLPRLKFEKDHLCSTC
ncbi:retrovirus-related pol polyprotein from transposon TNT 1-94, partial [Tanacetum coccineum]